MKMKKIGASNRLVHFVSIAPEGASDFEHLLTVPGMALFMLY